MHDLIQRNKRKLVAVFLVVLMIAFLLPAGMGSLGTNNPVVGKIGDEEILNNEWASHRQQWDVLTRLPFKGSQVPYAFRLASPEEFQMIRYLQQLGRPMRPPYIVQQIEEHPDAWMLLVREARAMGLRVNSIDVERAMTEEVQIPANFDQDQLAMLQEAVGNLLLVGQSMARIADNVKVSAPMRRHAKAESSQRIDVNLVELNALEYLAKVPAPTTQQVEKQFADFGSDAPGEIDSQRNPFGFGYRVPDRVKLQFVMVARQSAREAAVKSRDTYSWTVEARKDYLKNPARFMTTAPASTQSSSFDLSSPAPASQPTMQPFEQVRDTIVERLIGVEAEKLQAAVLSKVNAKFTSDYNAHSSKKPTSQPTTATGFTSFAYLQTLRDLIQQEDGVTLTIADVPEFKTSEELAGIESIGQASVQNVGFASYALELAEPLVPADRKNNSSVLPLFKASQVLTDDQDNAYIFRLTDAQAAHKPASADEARAKIEADLNNQAAYELAKADAIKLLDGVKVTDLRQGASLVSRPVLMTGAFSKSDALYGGVVSIPSYTVDPKSNTTFVNQAYQLLREASKSGKPRPVQLIELPASGKVLVAELQSVEPSNPTRSAFALDLETDSELAIQDVQVLRNAWVEWDELVQRTGWQPMERETPRAKEPVKTVNGNPFLRQ